MQKEMTMGDVQLGFELPPIKKHITQEKITKNAEASLDFNPIHIDPEWCKKVNLLGKGTTIAHGMMTLSFMGKVVTDWLYPKGGRLKALNGKFVHPVRPGDDLVATATVIELHPRHAPEESFFVLELECRNQDDVLVGVGTAVASLF